VDRGSESQYAGVGLEHTFSPALLGALRGGAQSKEFNDDSIDDETSPYVDGNVTVLASPSTRLYRGRWLLHVRVCRVPLSPTRSARCST
jgi:hypothetical protein